MLHLKQRVLSSSRSLILLLLAAFLILGGGGIYRLIEARAAANVAPSDVDWHIDQGVSGYNNMINAIRARVSARTLYDRTTETGPSSSVQRFYINIYALPGSQTPDVRLLMRTDNLYIEGWQRGLTGPFTYFSDTHPPIPAGAAGSGAAPFSSQYGNLESVAGATRGQIIMSQLGFQNSALDLGLISYSDINIRGNFAISAAQYLLRFVQATAEAARFNYIATKIANGYTSGWQADLQALALENNWSKLSKNMETGLQKGTVPTTTLIPPGTPGYTGGVILTTMAQYATLLAVALFILF